MKPIEGYDLINEAGEVRRLPAGIYGVVITSVTDVPEKEYLEITCDITKGEYKDYFKTLVDNGLKDFSKTTRSYKRTALSFFKGFITAVENSNQGYKWDWDEKKLIGKNVIAVFGEEEYMKDGQIKTSVKLVEFRSLDAYREGKIKVPEIKRLNVEMSQNETTSTEETDAISVFDDSELPF